MRIRAGVEAVNRLKKATLAVVAIALASAGRAGAASQLGSEVTEVAAPHPPVSELLTDVAGGVNASNDIQPVDLNSVADSGLYREYGVVEGASRRYGAARIDLFRTATPFGALGLFTLRAGLAESDGSNMAWLGDGLVLWRSAYFARVFGPRATAVKVAVHVVNAVSARDSRIVLPSLLDALPREPVGPASMRYILGPESLAAFVPQPEVFRFDGGAEAVLGEYRQQGSSTPLNLLVVEYHTPQFAGEAMERLSAFTGSLSGEEQGRILHRREGNFLIQATGVADRALAERLVSSIKYPYGVKWLKNPLLPNEDPLEAEKTAQVLISTFLIIALVGLIAMLIGGTFGALIFIKRRKQLRAVFSDAGGMLRLDIDPLPGTGLAASKSRLLGGGGE